LEGLSHCVPPPAGAVALCANHRPAAVRRLKPGLSVKGQSQRGRAGQAGTARFPTRHQSLPKQQAEAAQSTRLWPPLPSHANRLRKTARDSSMGEELCSRFRSRSSAQYFSPRLALGALVNSFFIFALLCSAVPRLPCVIYIPTRTVQSTGNIS
jgi:hypothetical protein